MTSVTTSSELGRYFGPYYLARFGAAAALLLSALFVLVSLYIPVADARFQAVAGQDAIAVTTADRTAFAVAPDAPVRFQAADGRTLSLPAGRLASAQAAEAPDRRELAGLVREGPVQARLTDAAGQAQTFTVGVRRAALRDMTPGYWVVIGFGMVGMLFAMGVWAVRPRDWAAACYAWTGVFLLASSLADGLFELWTVASPGAFLTASVLLNAATLQPFALGFLALFARFPRPLAKRRTVIAALAAGAVVGLISVVVIPVWGAGLFGVSQAVFYLGVLALVVVQFWVGRRDPLSRPALTILVWSIGLGVALYLLVTILPSIRGDFAPLQEVIAFPLFLLIYAGIGVAIVRANLLSMDRWIRTVMVSVTFVAAVLLVDLALVTVLVRQQSVALGLSLAACALVYFPTREWLARRSERRRSAQAQRSLQLATDLVFEARPAERAGRWRDAVEATFQPLEISADPAPVDAPQLAEQGDALRLPAVAGAPALVCRHAEAGRRAFGPGDVDAARALIAIVGQLTEARNAYERGATEERRRIARDLHDDVGGRLVTSLHRQDLAAIHMDVRDAMTDIRNIVSGLAGNPRQLGELMAELRYECVTRCEAAGIDLDWTPGAELSDSRPLDYSVYRHVSALLRESVSNVIRHAEAANVEIEVELEGDRIAVTVWDDGKGISTSRRVGNGLRNCVARAEALSGDFMILPVDEGAAVRFDVLLETPDG